MMLTRTVRLQRIAVGVVAATSFIAVTGCAGRKPSFSGRFVKPGEPTATYDVQPPAAPKPDGLREYARRLQVLQANARRNVTLGETLESRDPLLASAILRLSMLPSAENHRLVAEAYRAAGVTDYAYRHLNKAVQIEPCNSQAWEGMARLWRDWGSPDLALTDAHRAVYCRPQSASAYNTLGTVLAALGQRENARNAFAFALRLEPRAGFAMNNLCYLSLQDGDGIAAQQACTNALALDPTMVAAQTNLGLAYALQGNVPKAEARLLDNPDAAVGLFNVGVLRMSMNQYSEAATAFDLAGRERPSLVEAARRAMQARDKTAAIKER